MGDKIVDNSDCTLTLEKLQEAKDLLLRELEPTKCPLCKRKIYNRFLDILYVAPNRQVGCMDCVTKIIYKSIYEKDID